MQIVNPESLRHTLPAADLLVEQRARLAGWMNRHVAAQGGMPDPAAPQERRCVQRARRNHDRVRFHWTLAPEGGPTLVAGIDFATLAEGGRLASVTGFFDQVPKAA